MSSTASNPEPAVAPKAGRTWLLKPFWMRTFVIVLLLAVSLATGYWRQRSGVWSVLMAGGQALEMDLFHGHAIRSTEPQLPDFIKPLLRKAKPIGGAWSTRDDHIAVVNLSQSKSDDCLLRNLKNMTSLEYLILDRNQVGPQLASLSELSNLHEIKIHRASRKTPLEHLLTLRHLSRISLVNPESDATISFDLGKSTALHHLELVGLDSRTKSWAELLRQFEGWSNIEKISIRTFFPLTPGLESLQTCQSLTDLEISAPLSYSDFSAMARITGLCALTINARNLRRDDYLALRSLVRLRKLTIFTVDGERAPVDELRQLLPGCQIEIGP